MGSAALQQQQLLTEELAELTARNDSFEADVVEKRRQHAALVRQRMDPGEGTEEAPRKGRTRK